MATLRKRRNKWEARVRRSGFKTVSKSFIKKTDADAWARHIEICFDRGEIPAAPSETQKTFADIAQRYLKEISPQKKSHAVERYRIPRLLTHSFAKLRLKELNGPALSAYRDKRLKEVSGASVRKELYLISAIICYANAEWLDAPIVNPVLQITKPKDSRPRTTRLTDEDRSKLFNAMETSKHERLKAVILFALETGFRRGEILALHWNDVTLDKGFAHLKDTKNGEQRLVPLPAAAIQLIQLQPRADDRIFPLSANACRLGWERLRAKAGLRHVRFHDLRHDAISGFFERGLTVPEVTMLSGHKTKSQLFRYAHPDLLRLQKKLQIPH